MGVRRGGEIHRERTLGHAAARRRRRRRPSPGRRRRPARASTSSARSGATESTTRDADSEKHATASPISTSKPTPPAIAISARATASAAVGAVVHARGQRGRARARRRARGATRRRRGRRRAGVPSRRPWHGGPLRAAELGPGRRRAPRCASPSRSAMPGGGTSASSSISPMTPTTGVGSMSAPCDSVVEADVAADDRQAERPARLAHAVDDLGELPHHLGVLRVAEVQAVHERHRPRARCTRRCGPPRAPRAGHRSRGSSAQNRPLPSTESASAAARRLLEPQHAGVAARPGDGVEEQLVVVLAPDPALVGDVRRAEQRQQLAAEVGAGGEPRAERRRRDRRPEPRVVVGRAARGAGGRAGRRRGCRSARRRPACGPRTPRARRRRSAAAGSRRARRSRRSSPSYTRKRPESVTRPTTDRADLPALAEREHLVEVLGRHDRQHPLLALGGEHLDRVHARLALRRTGRRRRPCPRRSWPRSPTPRTTARRRRGPAPRSRARRRAARGTPR